ncbi:MAG: hypothetical protein QOI44_1416 [Actinomycetota bacterium]|nr:hypothetical protein [Actinomycetota bacterium]
MSVAILVMAVSATVVPAWSAVAGPISSASIAPLALNAPVVGMAATPSGKGAWRVASDGGVFTSGDAHFYGSTGAMHLNQPIVGIAATPTGRGYWFVAADGGVFTFGNARFHGSTGAMHLNQPIVGMASTRSGRGYWLIARDGGVFSFGDARFHGSTGAIHLNQPIVGGVATPSGRGYWFVAADGGVFTFGDARFYGSTGGAQLSSPIVGMASASDGRGYLLLSANGTVHKFGSARYFGSANRACQSVPAVAIATSRLSAGYWIAFANARAFALSPVRAAPTCGPNTQTKTAAGAADLFARLNDERRARGLPALRWNPTLASYASNWSRTMAASSMHHSDIGSLQNNFDYIGENIAYGKGAPESSLHIAWMHSGAHRDNMLSPGFTDVGIGMYCAADGSMWATTDFGRPWSAGQPPPYAGNTAPDPVARADANNIRC